MSILALAGNQNCGKTTLFNALTGLNQHVGNWPGVTVERKTGRVYAHREVEVVDLPGVYALSPYSEEEKVTRDFLLHGEWDAAVNVVDATSLERGLYLTLQLLTLGRPVVLALNMMDEVRKRGDQLDIPALSSALGIPVVPICARTGEGVEALLSACVPPPPFAAPPEPLSGPVRQAVRKLEKLIAPSAEKQRLSASFMAQKLLEGDTDLLNLLPSAIAEQATKAVVEATQAWGREGAAMLADARYRWIETLVRRVLNRADHGPTLTERIDRVALHPVAAFPLLAGMLLLVFSLTFGPVGSTLSEGFSALLFRGVEAADEALAAISVAPGLRSLVVSGVLTGVCSVLSFLPTLLVLFLCLSILEDSGYMARAAFLMDRPLRTLGLNGRCFIPLLMGFGCTVPAALATMAMPGRRDRRFTALLTPFISCGAKMPVYALISKAIFPRSHWVIIFALYLGGVLLAVCAAFVGRAVFTGDAAPFVMELPTYRLPRPMSVLRTMADKASGFVKKAFTVILLSTVLVWFLRAFTPQLQSAETARESLLAAIAGKIAPALRPLGFGSAEAAAALLTGLLAKESVLSTLSVLCGVDASSAQMVMALRQLFPTAASALAFLTFVLLYPPCAAAQSALSRAMESRRLAAFSFLAQITVAWGCAFCVCRIATLLGV